MPITINSYAELQGELNALTAANSLSPGQAPHGAFWNDLTYEAFMTGDVPGYPGYKIVQAGLAAQSNLVMALSGTPNTVFDPENGFYGQMPQPSAPYEEETPTQTDLIAAISAWINKGCPP